MSHSTQLRRLAGIVFAIVALSSLPVPVSAQVVVEGCDGVCGNWSLLDSANPGNSGGVCVYEKASFDLDYIKIRPPFMNGYYDAQTKVGWRFWIRRAPVSTGVFTTIYKSSWQKATASKTYQVFEGHGFSRRKWTAPESPHGFFDVWVEVGWWSNGHREGSGLANYEWYKAKHGTASHTSSEYCLEDY